MDEGTPNGAIFNPPHSDSQPGGPSGGRRRTKHPGLSSIVNTSLLSMLKWTHHGEDMRLPAWTDKGGCMLSLQATRSSAAC